MGRVHGQLVACQPGAGHGGADTAGEQVVGLDDDVVGREEAVAGLAEGAVGLDRGGVGGVVAVDEGDHG